MPAAAATKTARAPAAPPVKTHKTRNMTKESALRAHDSDVIVLSSDTDEDVPISAKARPIKKRKTLLKGKDGAGGKEGDGEEQDEGTVARLRRELRLAQQEIDSLQVSWKDAEALLESTQDEVKHLKLSSNVKGISALEEQLSCEICTTTMWTPYTLAACGHTFCSSCLQDWFNTTLAQHIERYPEYRARIVIPAHWLRALEANQRDPYMRSEIQTWVARQRATMPQPSYSCPTCRMDVTNKPVEVYKLKELVRSVATLTGGDGSPKRTGKPNANPFEGFFPEDW